MIRHLFKLAWRRKRASALLMLEISISFLVVFGLSLVTAQVWSNYVKPVGYRWQEAWVVEIGVARLMEEPAGEKPAQLQRMLAETRAMPEVAAAGLLTAAPYQGSRMVNAYQAEGREIRYELSYATPGIDAALGIQPLRGRWFEEADLALSYRPVVIDEGLAAVFFPGDDPVGKPLPRGDNETGPEQRILGVVPSYRTGGDLSAAENFLFELVDGVDSGNEPLASTMVLQLRPGVDGSFEERLTRHLQAMAPEWSIEMRPMAHMRETYLRSNTAPLFIGGVIALFLMLMVGLGLTGVLWQNVTQRTREIGLRRAAGAAAGDVQRQVLGEILVLTTLGLTAGIVLVVQLPLLDLLGGFRGASFGAALAASIGIVYALAAVCAWYPGRLAIRMTPAEALHYD